MIEVYLKRKHLARKIGWLLRAMDSYLILAQEDGASQALIDQALEWHETASRELNQLIEELSVLTERGIIRD